jgi:hypothetical protein
LLKHFFLSSMFNLFTQKLNAVYSVRMQIEDLITQFTLTGLATRCGVASQVIYNWRRRGIPVDQVLHIARSTEWFATPHQLRPDLYPNPTDGLPVEVAAITSHSAQ